jgi:D-glycero-D-manno-heptose 1,7-bisphosphate phosphatase
VSRRAVFLDRDGVLNRALVVEGTPRAPESIEDLEILPGVEEACRRLRRADFVLVVVTNQPDIARGAIDAGVVDSLNEHLVARLHLDDVMVCPHDDGDRCDCRKPLPGMLVQGALRHGVDLSRSYMVGDRWRDIEAGRRAGCVTVYIDRGYAERRAEDYDAAVADLSEAASWILTREAASSRQKVTP